MKYTFTREQVKKIILEEVERSRDEDEAKKMFEFKKNVSVKNNIFTTLLIIYNTIFITI